ncbi:MAG TPA: class A beta-lactamase [Oligoflexus sp.]|uniref:class A beta-lactamase n=1 Tax=Oligoflexus sp. TaxID=1971216 RepID=UPI002D6E80DC|nr:class A beta-lactamase [Oligoflexus sp.]HYX35925.1 class A beta-lactamase [Oligoflexus sp.]
MITNFLVLAAVASSGTFASRDGLHKELKNLSTASEGKVGVCALDALDVDPVCVHGTEPFALQSVVKLIVSAAVLDAVDAGTIKWDETILVKPEDASPGPRDFADLVRKQGQYPATVEELIRRSIVDSDSTSVDVLIKRLGGVVSVQAFLKKKQITGIRVDRMERDLQAEFSGLSWQPSYADPGLFKAAVEAVAADKRQKALEAYLKDPRDTSTPVAMVKFLKGLASGQILSETSTKKLMSILEKTATGKDRLRGGLPKSWRIGHKTGTSASYKGRTATTNDVGILTAPDGGTVAIAVFVSDSMRNDQERAAVIAKASQIVTSAYQGRK